MRPLSDWNATRSRLAADADAYYLFIGRRFGFPFSPPFCALNISPPELILLLFPFILSLAGAGQ